MDPIPAPQGPAPEFDGAVPPAEWLPPRPVSAAARWLERVRMAGFALDNLLYMLVRVAAAPRFWWYERTGRAQDAEALARRFTLKWTGRIFRRLRCRVEVEGLEHMLRDEPVVVMANHQAIYDIPLLLGFAGRQLGFVFKRELLRIPGLRYWMLRNHCVALDRDDPRQAAALYRELGEALRNSSRALVLFPEGTRSRDPQGAIGEFRRGALRLAQAGKLRVQPVVLEGTRHLVDAAAMARTRDGERVVRLRILPPRNPPEGGAPAAKQFMDTLREDMIRTRRELYLTWTEPGPTVP